MGLVAKLKIVAKFGIVRQIGDAEGRIGDSFEFAKFWEKNGRVIGKSVDRKRLDERGNESVCLLQ